VEDVKLKNTSSVKHTYGPVPSRRLRRSLGVDIVPYKICNYDCIYCQLGKTKNKTIERKEYISPTDILSDLREYLKSINPPDYISISGSGEPTLNSSIEEVLAKIIDKINPDKIQVYTVARPPAEDFAFGVNQSQLAECCKLIGNSAEIIANFTRVKYNDHQKSTMKDVLELISRRPCSIEDVVGGLSIQPNEVIKYVDVLISNGCIIELRHSEKIFYTNKKKGV